MTPIDYSSVIRRVCDLISLADIDAAASEIRLNYPFAPVKNSGRTYTPRAMIKIFMRDGFIDRYRGTRLVFPPTLRVLSHRLASDFPYHKNGKMTEGHLAYWELFPTIDHIQPVARGGPDSEDNWVCCSMLTNSIKANWTLEQLQWSLLPKGDLADWDGLMNWFVEYVERDRTLLEMPYMKKWWYAARSALNSH